MYKGSTTFGLYKFADFWEPNYLAEPSKGLRSIYARMDKTPACIVLILAVLFLVSGGITHRQLAPLVKLVIDIPIALAIPMSSLPTRIGDCVGNDLSIRTTTRDFMQKYFTNDFLTRQYINSIPKAWADVCITDCLYRADDILGRRPRVCYPAHGWVHDSTERPQFISRAGQQVDCLIYRFHKPALMHDRTVVLNFYISKHQLTTDENDFSGPFSRRPNIARDLARYVTQVRISSMLEISVRTAAKHIADARLNFLSDGKITATKYGSGRTVS